jgi:3-phenylpropionate/trans-cinnamate dioxygenase ferredoxin subunit
MPRHIVATANEIPEGGRKLVTIGNRPITVFHTNGEYFALYDKCPHEGGSLCAGKLTGLVQSDRPGDYRLERKGEIVRCPWHGWEFDLRTGQSYCDPRRFRVKSYEAGIASAGEVVEGPYKATTFPVTVDEDYVFVEI